jgi:hypothetical protein
MLILVQELTKRNGAFWNQKQDWKTPTVRRPVDERAVEELDIAPRDRR